MPKLIPLTRGLCALVDDVDYDWLSQWRWLVVGPGYAGRFEKVGGGRQLLYMHRVIVFDKQIGFSRRFGAIEIREGAKRGAGADQNWHVHT